MVVFDTHTTESPALFIVGDRRQVIQQGGVSPALVNLENKEIESEDIMTMMSLILCNKRKCWSSSLPSQERRIGNLANSAVININIKHENIDI